MSKRWFLGFTVIIFILLYIFVVYGDQILHYVNETGYEQINGSAINTVKLGEKYFITVISAEISPKTSDNESWDIDDSAPDSYVEIWWRENKVSTSPVITDSLLPVWNDKSINLAEAITTGNLEARPTGAMIKIQKNDEVIIKLLDQDLVATADTITLYKIITEKLKSGNNLISAGNNIITLRVIPFRDIR